MTHLIWPQGTCDTFNNLSDAEKEFRRLYPDAYYIRVPNIAWPFIIRQCYGDREESINMKALMKALMIEILE